MKKKFLTILFSLMSAFIPLTTYADESNPCEPTPPPPDTGNADCMAIEIGE